MLGHAANAHLNNNFNNKVQVVKATLEHIHHTTIFTITVTIVLIHQMIAHHFPTQADVMGAVAVTKKPFHIKGLLSSLR
ncbi:hypothetical protein VXR60_03570 [Acinetobacter baumannii]|uniref:hypothetical protein n=1 Tax=Acinetobacter baumannii TaxID=470 RepID=UPI003A875B11